MSVNIPVREFFENAGLIVNYKTGSHDIDLVDPANGQTVTIPRDSYTLTKGFISDGVSRTEVDVAWISDMLTQDILIEMLGDPSEDAKYRFADQMLAFYGGGRSTKPVPAAPGGTVSQQPPAVVTAPAPADPWGLYDPAKGHNEGELWQPGGVQDVPVITLPFSPGASGQQLAPVPGVPTPVQPVQPGGISATPTATQAQPVGLGSALDQAIGAINNIFIAINRVVSSLANNASKWVPFAVGAWVLVNVAGLGLGFGGIRAGRRG